MLGVPPRQVRTKAILSCFLLSITAIACSSRGIEGVSEEPIKQEQTGASSGKMNEDHINSNGQDLAIPADVDVDLVVRFMGLDWSSENIQFELTEEKRLHQEREDAAFDCMHEHGFDYTREPFDVPSAVVDSGEHGDFGSREWHEHYGYGISTFYWPQELLPADVPGDPSERIIDDSSQEELDFTDWSHEEQQAYALALYGDDETPGCLARAWEKTSSEYQESVRNWAELLYEVAAQVLANEAVVTYENGLRDCVTEKGYIEFAGATAFMDSLAAQLNTLFAGVGDGEAPPEEIVEALRLIQQQERDIAVAEFDCRLPQDEEIALLRRAVESVLDVYR